MITFLNWLLGVPLAILLLPVLVLFVQVLLAGMPVRGACAGTTLASAGGGAGAGSQ
jgi:hypothetical protein